MTMRGVKITRRLVRSGPFRICSNSKENYNRIVRKKTLRPNAIPLRAVPIAWSAARGKPQHHNTQLAIKSHEFRESAAEPYVPVAVYYEAPRPSVMVERKSDDRKRPLGVLSRGPISHSASSLQSMAVDAKLKGIGHAKLCGEDRGT